MQPFNPSLGPRRDLPTTKRAIARVTARATARRCVSALLLAVVALCVIATTGASAASAASAATPATEGPASPALYNGIDVVELAGFIDPANASLIRHSIAAAEQRQSTALIFQMSSPGVIDTDPVALARAVRAARVPVVIWVGPAGSEVRGGAALIAESGSWLSVASNAHIGPILPLRADGVTPHESAAELRSLTSLSKSGFDAIATRQIGASAAKVAHSVNAVDPVIGNLVVSLNGKVLRTGAGPSARLSTAEVTSVNGQPRERPNQDVRFAKLSLGGQFQHALDTPWVAYFLLAVGAALVVFEFFTISIGIAGVIGAVCLVFSCYGFSHLPVHWWAAGVLLFAFVGFAIDVQAGGLGPWTGIGVVGLVVGSIWLYGGTAQVQPEWWTLLLVIASSIVFMIGAMTGMLRSRFGTPTVGREGMIGELGLAEVDIAPDGVARVREALWRARTNRATPVKHGEIVRVVAVEGLVLEVEPETGGARDHRDRSRARS
jgi:membrane-bound serine protease (ClpP class)